MPLEERPLGDRFGGVLVPSVLTEMFKFVIIYCSQHTSMNTNGSRYYTTMRQLCPNCCPADAFKQTMKKVVHVTQLMKVVFTSSFATIYFTTQYVICFMEKSLGMLHSATKMLDDISS